jgi:cytochrome c-type biogenesis protein CcmE
VTTTTPVAPAPDARPPVPSRRRPKKARYVVAAGGCLLAVVAVIVLTIVLSENVVYFRTVSEAVKDRTSQGTGRFRLAGAVVPGTIHETSEGVDFSVTDGKKTVAVVHHGDPPELFKNGAPVVCEGRWAAVRTGAPFDSDRILIKHGASYSPPKVDTKQAPKAETSQ